MPRTTSMTLGPELDAFIAQQVQSGRYASASEVLRAGIRELERAQQTQAEVKLQLNRAFADGFDLGSAALLRWISLQHCSTHDRSAHDCKQSLAHALRKLADEVEQGSALPAAG